MHIKQLVELAAVVATESSVIVRGTQRLPAEALEEYWVASKCRLQHWTDAIAQFHHRMKWASTADKQQNWLSSKTIFEEILAGEILTRVWTGVLVTLDDVIQTDELAPVARSVFVGHLEARNRTLRVLAHPEWTDNVQCAALNKTRRQVERWTDLLLAYLATDQDVTEFSFDRQRLDEFARELRWESPARRTFSQPLFAYSLRRWLRSLDGCASSAALNVRVANSVFASLGPELFHQTGQLSSLWQIRLTKTTDDAQGWIEQLLGDDDKLVTPRADLGWLRRS